MDERKVTKNKKTKILRIIARLNIGGPAIHTVLLSQGLDSSVFDTVLLTGMPDKDEGDMSYLAEDKGIKPVIIPELRRELNIINDLIALYKIFHLVRRERPDIIHTHTAKAGTLGRLAGIFNNLIPGGKRCVLIHTFHGHVLHSYFGKARTLLFIWIERLLGVFTDRIIVVSENLKKELLRLRVSRSGKITVVLLGLELQKYLNINKDGISHRDYQSIGIVGRLVPIKNHRFFLNLVKALKDRTDIKRPLRFFIIGDGYLHRELEDYARRLGVSSSVVFTGWKRDLTGIYADLDIVVLTSLNEGTPVSLIEAMAAGKPVIATNVGGVKDLLIPAYQRLGITTERILIRPDDTEGFANSLSLLLSDDSLRANLGQAGREFVKTTFTKERLIRDMEKLYNNFFHRRRE